MLGGMWMSLIRRLSCLGLNPPPHQNSLRSHSSINNGAKLATQWRSCDICVEENDKVCQCGIEHELKEHEKFDGIDSANEPQKVKANSSFAHSVINMVGMLIGLGQLSTPYALETGGWASAFLLVGLGIACAYTSHLLGKCLKKNEKLRNYPDIGYQAFGMKGKVIASTFIYLEVFMALVSYTISLSDNLPTVFAGKTLHMPWMPLSSTQFLTVIAIVVALPSLWLRDLSSISFLSTGGIIMSFLIFITVPFAAVFGGIKANRSIPVLQLQNLPVASGLYIFSFAGHIVFPNLYKSMKDPSQFTKVSIVSFAIVTTLYTSFAFIGAKLFGPEVNSQITLSMPRHLIVTKIALWATVLTPLTKYALEFAPLAMHLDQKLPSLMSSKMKMLIRGSVGSFLLLVILALALSIPYFEHVLGLTGSLVSIGVSIIFPCAFYTKIFWSQHSKPLLVLNLILVIFGSISAIFGTISSSKSLLNSILRSRSSSP